MSDEWLKELQDEVAEWSQENFGVSPLHGGDGSPPEQPLIGTGEELGELTTSVLKREQGIADSPKYEGRAGDDVERDAIGYTTIYILDTLHRAEDDISVYDELEHGEKQLSTYNHIDDAVSMIRMLYGDYGRLVGKRFHLISDEDWGDPDEYEWKSESDSLDILQHNATEIVSALQRFCELRGFDYKSCVIDAWEEVSKREWDSEVIQ